MSKSHEIEKFISEQCDKYSLYLEDRGRNSFKVWTGHVSGLSLIINLDNPREFNYHFLVRTFDILYHGDRSDAHVIISLMFSSFLRTNNHAVSSSLFDIPHPVIRDEIWGRYIVPIQDPEVSGVLKWHQIKLIVTDLIRLLGVWSEVFWHFASCPCDECRRADDKENYREYKIPSEIKKALYKTFGRPNRSNHGGRIRPKWYYLYDIDHEVTIIKSEELSLYLNCILNLSDRKPEKISGVNGKLIIDNGIHNFISSESINELHNLFQELLKTTQSLKFPIIAMENMIISVMNPYIIALGRLSGLHEFRIEREAIRQRHNRESALLFPIPQFEWRTEVCPDQFESLVKALLEREPNVLSVRKASPINQGDKGRDLIIEWNIIDKTILSETRAPIKSIKVVGQCKASNKTVSKSKVLDIRDTIETHQSQGFFLAVSSQLSAALTEKLEALKSVGIWTQWWNRDDIEMRVSRNQDLLPLFPKVLEAKHTIRFVDKK